MEKDPTVPVAALWDAFDRRVFDDALPWLDPGFIAEWPQTNERIRGAEAFVRLNEAYPGQWACRPLSIETIARPDRRRSPHFGRYGEPSCGWFLRSP